MTSQRWGDDPPPGGCRHRRRPHPSAIRRVLNVNGAITDGRSGGPLQGPVQQWTDELTELVVGYVFDTFLLWAEGDEQLERFALEVVPAARQQLAAETS